MLYPMTQLFCLGFAEKIPSMFLKFQKYILLYFFLLLHLMCCGESQNRQELRVPTVAQGQEVSQPF